MCCLFDRLLTGLGHSDVAIRVGKGVLKALCSQITVGSGTQYSGDVVETLETSSRINWSVEIMANILFPSANSAQKEPEYMYPSHLVKNEGTMVAFLRGIFTDIKTCSPNGSIKVTFPFSCSRVSML